MFDTLTTFVLRLDDIKEIASQLTYTIGRALFHYGVKGEVRELLIEAEVTIRYLFHNLVYLNSRINFIISEAERTKKSIWENQDLV